MKPKLIIFFLTITLFTCCTKEEKVPEQKLGKNILQKETAWGRSTNYELKTVQ